MDATAGLESIRQRKNVERAPRPGDVSLCMKCAAPLQFDAELRMQWLTSEELVRVSREALDGLVIGMLALLTVRPSQVRAIGSGTPEQPSESVTAAFEDTIATLRKALATAALPLEVLFQTEMASPWLAPLTKRAIVDGVHAIRGALFGPTPAPANGQETML